MSSSGWVPEPTANAERVLTARAVDAAAMRQRGAEVASVVRAGDVLVIDGPLGAGKTTFVQGLAAALGVRGAVTSPTFVISRVHRGPRVDLVHVDAYRLSGALELDDLDLDAEVSESVTVIEWGSGKAEELAADRLHIVITSETDDAPSEAASTADNGLPEGWQSGHGIAGADAGRGRLAADWSPAGQNPEVQNPEDRNPEDRNPEDRNPEDRNPEDRNPEDQNPEDQNPEDQNPEDQNPEDQNPEDFGLFDASAGIRIIRVLGVGPRWAQLQL